MAGACTPPGHIVPPFHSISLPHPSMHAKLPRHPSSPHHRTLLPWLQHYSVDVVVAFYTVPLVFYTMHRRWTTKRPVQDYWCAASTPAPAPAPCPHASLPLAQVAVCSCLPGQGWSACCAVGQCWREGAARCSGGALERLRACKGRPAQYLGGIGTGLPSGPVAAGAGRPAAQQLQRGQHTGRCP